MLSRGLLYWLNRGDWAAGSHDEDSCRGADDLASIYAPGPFWGFILLLKAGLLIGLILLLL